MTENFKDKRVKTSVFMTQTVQRPKIPDGNSPEVVLGDGALEISVMRARDLVKLIEIWDDLAQNCCDQNVFFESWMLLPAIEAFGTKSSLEFHLIWAPGCGPQSEKPLLCGFFPFERKRRYKGLRADVLTLWKPIYGLLCTALVRKNCEKRVLEAILENLSTSRAKTQILQWNSVAGEGPFWQALLEVLNARQSAVFVDETWNRALLRPKTGQNSDEYLREALTGKKRKELRRQENRLSECGTLRYVHFPDDGGDLEHWISDFLALEASGWKGKAGSAFACNSVHERFFRAVAAGAHRRGQLAFNALQIDGKAITIGCDFLSGEGAFAFKIAFDESFSRFSPGVLLEIEAVCRLHGHPKTRWVDSCAIPDHSMINRLWTERRTLQNLVIATKPGRGEILVSFLPVMRLFKRAIGRLRKLKKSK